MSTVYFCRKTKNPEEVKKLKNKKKREKKKRRRAALVVGGDLEKTNLSKKEVADNDVEVE